MEGRFSEVVSESAGMIDKGYGPKDEVYYLKALGELKLKRFDAAREDFAYIISRYPRTQKAFDSYVGIGDSYMLAGDLNTAIGEYNRVPDEFPSNKNLPIVYSRLAGCYNGLGLKDKADRYSAMANNASPLSFEARGQAVAASQSVVRTAERPMAVAGPRPVPPQPKAVAPSTNIVPKNASRIQSPEEMDVIMVKEGSISVQVGSFKNRRNAENLAKKLASSGYQSRVEIPVVQGDKIYRVKAGSVSTMAEAEALAARLKAAGYNTKICDGEKCR